MEKKKITLLIFSFFLFISFKLSFSADIYLISNKTTVKVGENFSLTIYVDSPDQEMNAVSFDISYPANLVKVNSLSKSGSFISLWVQEPLFSNNEIQGEGVIMNPGFIGKRGKILTINLTALREGKAEFKFLSGYVLANDGYGTNLTKNLNGVIVTIKPTVSKIIEEKPNIYGKVPLPPKIISFSHPDQNKWYNIDSGSIFWEIKPDQDVKFINLTIYHNDKKIDSKKYPPEIKEYKFENLENGIYEFRVSLENDYGKSKESVYQIKIDKEVPRIKILEVLRDNLAYNPQFEFDISDSFSGFSHLEIKIDDQEPVIIKELVYSPSNLQPGTHKIYVKAFDQAGNYNSLEKEFYIKEKVEVLKIIKFIYWLIFGGIILVLILILIEIYRTIKLRKILRKEILDIDLAVNKAFKTLRSHVVKQLSHLDEIKKNKRTLRNRK